MSGPPVNAIGELITRESFETRMAALRSGNMTPRREIPAMLAAMLEQLMKEALETTRFRLAIYRVTKFLSDFEREFSPPELHGTWEFPESFDDVTARHERLIEETPAPTKKSAGSKKKEPDQEPKASGSKKEPEKEIKSEGSSKSRRGQP